MTSRGQVTTPEVKPPTAPDMALNWDSEAWAAQRSKALMWTVGLCMVVSGEAVIGLEVDMAVTVVLAVCPSSAGGEIADCSCSSSDIPLLGEGGLSWVLDGGACVAAEKVARRPM